MSYLSVDVMEAGNPMVYEVLGGIGGLAWKTYKHRPDSKSLHSLRSPMCPDRATPEEAETDLAAYCALRLGDVRPLYELVAKLRDETNRLRSLLANYGGTTTA